VEVVGQLEVRRRTKDMRILVSKKGRTCAQTGDSISLTLVERRGNVYARRLTGRMAVRRTGTHIDQNASPTTTALDRSDDRKSGTLLRLTEATHKDVCPISLR
jgi:hypothetical protein